MKGLRASLPLLVGLALAAGPRSALAERPDDSRAPVPRVSAAGPQDSIGTYGFRTSSNNLVNITITNSGSWGLGLTSAANPNFSYPSGGTFEHMVRGGLWIGAKVLCDTCPSGEQIAVSFGSEDENGSTNTPITEFTPAPNKASTRIQERSSLENSPNFSKLAVSEQDLIARFRDYPGNQVGEELHVPLDVDVTEYLYSWSFSFAESFVIQHFDVRNNGELLRNVYLTHYTEMQSLNKAIYSPYPPSTFRPSPYSKKKLIWVPEQRLLVEQYCEGSNCHFEKVPVYAGVVLLGTRPDTIINLNPKLLTRKYAGTGLDEGNNYARANDSEKYNFMQLPEEFEAQDPGNSDPSQWFTVGPIASIQHDSVVSFDLAFVGGLTLDDIKTNAAHAQLAFNLRYNLPTPPPSPRLYARPVKQGLELLWEGSPDTVFDSRNPTGQERDFEGYRIYLGDSRSTLKLISQFDKKDTTGFNSGLDSLLLPPGAPIVFGADTMKYHYVLRGLRDGFKYFASVTSFDTGNPRIESLESGKTQNLIFAIPGADSAEAAGSQVTVFPNPYRVEARWDSGSPFAKDRYLWFANLPTHCHLRIYTLGGDLVQDVNFDGTKYQGDDHSRGVYSSGRDFGIKAPILSGSMYAWDLISRFNQAVSSGMYLYSVEEIPSGKRQVGKFVILKSDRRE